MNMKKFFAMMLVLCVAVTMLVACGEKTEEPTTNDTTTTETTTTETTTTDNTTTTENTTEKPADTTTPAAGNFENAIFAATLPETWTATDDGAMVVTMAKKDDPTSAITATYYQNFPATLDEYVSKTFVGATPEDVTIGANTFKKVVSMVGDKEKTNLVAFKGTTLVDFVVENFAGTDEQAILGSINLK